MPRFERKFVMFLVVLGAIAFDTYPPLKAAEVVEFESAMYPPTPFKIKKAKELRIALETEPGIPLRGFLAKPLGDGPFPAVVLMHGCGGISEWDEVWTNRLVAWGYVVLDVDSLEPRGETYICDRPFAVPVSSRTLDAYGAKIYLSTLPFVDPMRIAVMGMSHGGWAVLHAIKRSISANLKRKPFQAAVALYPWCEESEKIDTPTLILIGDKDDWTPANRCVRYVDTLQTPHGTTLKVFAGAQHAFDFEGIDKQVEGHTVRYDPQAAEKAIQMIRAFLGKWL